MSDRPRHRPARARPAELTPGWPHTRSDDIAAEAVRLLVLAIQDAAPGASLRQLASRTGLNHAAINNLLAGRSWPDSRTLALLESGLETRLWPTLTPIGYDPAPPALVEHISEGEGAE